MAPPGSTVTVRWESGLMAVFFWDRRAGRQQFRCFFENSHGMGAAETCVKLRQVPAGLKTGKGPKSDGKRSSWSSKHNSVPLPQDQSFPKFRYGVNEVSLLLQYK